MNKSKRGVGLKLLVQEDQKEAEFWRKFRVEGDDGARRHLFSLYSPFARGLARKEYAIRPKGGEISDYEQLAYEGLLQAMEKFDPFGGVPFRQYAAKRIIGNVRNGLVRYSEANAQYSYRYRQERERLRSLITNDGAETDALTALAELAANLALGLIIQSAKDPVDVDGIPADGPTAYESISWNQLKKQITKQIDDLPEKEAFLIRQHYIHDLKFSQIAELLSLSKGRISQLHSTALKRLQNNLSRHL